MTDLEDLWRQKSDEQLLEAMGCLDEYTDEGQSVIRRELLRRGLAEPARSAILVSEIEAIARCYRRFVTLVGLQWLALALIVFAPQNRDNIGGLLYSWLAAILFLVGVVLTPMTGYKLLKSLGEESPYRLAAFVSAPLLSLLSLGVVRSIATKWSKRHGVPLDFLGLRKDAVQRLRRNGK